jgi:hypothetical protein
MAVAIWTHKRKRSGGAVYYLRDLLSDDPSVLLLECDGIEAFVLRTGQRILNDHRDQIVTELLSTVWRTGPDTKSPTVSFLPI